MRTMRKWRVMSAIVAVLLIGCTAGAFAQSSFYVSVPFGQGYASYYSGYDPGYYAAPYVPYANQYYYSAPSATFYYSAPYYRHYHSWRRW